MENLVELTEKELLGIDGGGFFPRSTLGDLFYINAEIAEGVITFAQGFTEGMLNAWFNA